MDDEDLSAIDDETAQRVGQPFPEIWDALRITYTEEGARIWLTSRNRNLARLRPLDLMRHGEADRVLEAARAIEGGS